MSYPTSLDTFTDVVDQKDAISESKTVTGVAPYTVTTTYPILAGTVVSIAGLTASMGPPGPGNFQVVYGTTRINFNSAQASVTYTIAYTTKGSPLVKTLWNPEYTAIETIEATLGINPQGIYATVDARITAISAGVSHTHYPDEDLTAQIPVTSDLTQFVIANVPAAGSTEVFLNGLEVHRTEYTILGSQLVLTTAPTYGETLTVSYYV